MSSRSHEVTPEKIMQLGWGFTAAKTLLSAIELGLFTALASGPLTTEELTSSLGLAPRSARDFFDTLVSLGMLERENDSYRNTGETATFLVRDLEIGEVGSSGAVGMPRDVELETAAAALPGTGGVPDELNVQVLVALIRVVRRLERDAVVGNQIECHRV